VNLFRRGTTAPQDEEEGSSAAGTEITDMAEDEDAGTGARSMAETGRPAASPPQTEKQQKAAQRASRMDLVRQARKASSAMQDPEPVRGLMVAAFLVAVGLLSYFSQDVEQVSQKVHGKTQVVSQPITHPATAVLLVVVALACAATIYWRRRYVTGIAFMVAAAIGIGAPLPKSLSDLMWLTFLVPAGYVLWLLMFRMNKEQKAWLAAHGASNQSSASTSSGGTGRQKSSQKRQPAAASSRSRNKGQVAVNASGRALPESSGRYTRPKSKPKANTGPK
jgi:hypothetical protein